MFQPLRCPYPSCRFHLHPPPLFCVRRGVYRPRCRNHPVQRFLCRACGRSFSRQTFRADFRHKKPHLNAPFLRLMVSCVAMRQAARFLQVARRTIEHRFRWLARHAANFQSNHLPDATLAGPFQLDELESFESNRFQPVTVPGPHHLFPGCDGRGAAAAQRATDLEPAPTARPPRGPPWTSPHSFPARGRQGPETLAPAHPARRPGRPRIRPEAAVWSDGPRSLRVTVPVATASGLRKERPLQSFVSHQPHQRSAPALPLPAPTAKLVYLEEAREPPEPPRRGGIMGQLLSRDHKPDLHDTRPGVGARGAALPSGGGPGLETGLEDAWPRHCLSLIPSISTLVGHFLIRKDQPERLRARGGAGPAAGHFRASAT